MRTMNVRDRSGKPCHLQEATQKTKLDEHTAKDDVQRTHICSTICSLKQHHDGYLPSCDWYSAAKRQDLQDTVCQRTEHAEELQVSPMKSKLLLHSSYTGHAVEQYVNIHLPSMPRHLSNEVPGRP